MFWIAQAADARSISGSVRRPNVALAAVGERDDQQLAAFAHAFDLQPHEFVPALAERVGGRTALGLDQRVDRGAQRRIGDADEAPRLHEADARCVVRRAQAREHGRIDGRRREVAHVAPFENGAVDGGEVGIVETHGREGRDNVGATIADGTRAALHHLKQKHEIVDAKAVFSAATKSKRLRYRLQP